MSPQRRLIIASIFFAVFWTAGMIWWKEPTFVGAIVLMFSGMLAGTLWYFGMRWWINRINQQAKQ